MSAQPSNDEELAAERLEMQIEATRQAFLGAKTREMRLELQETMKRLIAKAKQARFEHGRHGN